MTKELVISANGHETKVALIEDDQLVEIYFQRANEYSLAGSVHKGRVTRVLPGMQSAFVDVGLERDTFLYVSDFFEESDEYEKLPLGPEDKPVIRQQPLPRPVVIAPAAPAAPVVVVAAPVAGAAAPEAGVQLAAAQPQTERREDRGPERPRGDRGDRGVDRGGDRDGRGGRRGRRRRGRGGRGFPESKFSDARPVAGAAPVEESVPADVERVVAARTMVDDFSVLPGETLRKYKRPDEGEVERAGELADDEADDANGVDDANVVDDANGNDVNDASEESAEEPASTEVEVIAVAQGDSAIAEGDFGSVEEAREAIPDDVLDQIQIQAEARLAAAQAGGVAAAADEVVEDSVESDLDVEDAEDLEEEEEDEEEEEVEASGEDDSADEDSTDEEDDDEDAGEEEVAAEASGEAKPPGEAGAEGEEGPEPALASMESIGSSHREQTARFRGRRMRRRRGGSGGGAPDLRTVGREAAPEAGGAERPAERAAGERSATERPSGGRAAGERVPGERTSTERTRERSGDRSPRQRGERGGRGDRGDRGDRGERPDRAASGERERGDRAERPERSERPSDRPPPASISELLKEGQEIVVQIAKEPLGQKGARITSHIALPGRYCVYMPTVEHLGVSRKIASDEERQRLRRILQKHREGIPGGFIIRTAGEGKTEEQIASDIQYLAHLWQEIKQKADSVKSPALLYHDVAIVQRLLRDQLTENFKAIWVDNEELYESVVRFVQRMQPSMVPRIKLYTRSVPILDAFNITAELEKALRPKVWLKSGGYIVINQTEALVAIDINTGKYVGKSNRLEDTIVKTNVDACKEIVRQIRLRDLGGIIVVDFIDMDERKNRIRVMQALEEAIRADRAPNKIIPFNEFGLVAITRKRVKQSLERALCSSCPTCEGSGWVKSVQTVVGEILVEAIKFAPHVDGKEVMLRVHPTVAATLKSKDTSYLEELEGLFKRPVLVKSDETLHPEKFDLG